MSPKKEKPKHLGRGLQSLISSTAMAEETPEQVRSGEMLAEDMELRKSFRSLSIDLIDANPYQPRTVWKENELTELAESIRVNGLIQPIVVRPSGGRYELIAGERRFRASKQVGLKEMPALVRNATDEEMLELALVENIHRSDLNPIERAKAYKNYIESFSLSQTEAAQKLGEGRSVVANYIRLLDLPQSIQQMLMEGSLSMGHARALLGLSDDNLRNKLANRAMAGRLSVRDVERLVRGYLTGGVDVEKIKSEKPAHIMDLESRLRNDLGTKVSIQTRKDGQKGKIVIEFYSLDEFDRLTERMGINTLEEV